MSDTPDKASQQTVAINEAFSIIAQWTSRQCGRPSTFALAFVTVLLWAVTGPVFHYSDTWQLVINTGTTIVTFLMVFLIQNTQNRDMAVLHLKLDELIRVSESARNKLLNLEDMTEEELARLKGNFTELAQDAPSALLEEAKDNLASAGHEIQQATKKVAAASSLPESNPPPDSPATAT